MTVAALCTPDDAQVPVPSALNGTLRPDCSTIHRYRQLHPTAQLSCHCTLNGIAHRSALSGETCEVSGSQSLGLPDCSCALLPRVMLELRR
jgi:hypothetical protein